VPIHPGAAIWKIRGFQRKKKKERGGPPTPPRPMTLVPYHCGDLHHDALLRREKKKKKKDSPAGAVLSFL